MSQEPGPRPPTEVLTPVPQAPSGRPGGPSADSGGDGGGGRAGDRIFSGLAGGASILLLVIIAGIAVFLIWKSIPAIQADTVSFLREKTWFPDSDPSIWGIAAVAWGTVLSSILAMIMAVPIAVGIALFTAHYAPRRMAAALGYLVDLLAAVPSVVYGLWGLYVLVPHMIGLTNFLADHFGWFFLFATPGGTTAQRTMFNASVVLAVMILPIVSAVSREVFLQVPTAHVEGALALGATRWEMIRMSVLPFGRSGVISASMLGLGRALGETVAVALVLSTSYTVSWHILEPGGNTIAANIALQYGFAGEIGISALIASGMVLFFITLAVNITARWIIGRRAAFSGAN